MAVGVGGWGRRESFLASRHSHRKSHNVEVRGVPVRADSEKNPGCLQGCAMGLALSLGLFLDSHHLQAGQTRGLQGRCSTRHSSNPYRWPFLTPHDSTPSPQCGPHKSPSDVCSIPSGFLELRGLCIYGIYSLYGAIQLRPACNHQGGSAFPSDELGQGALFSVSSGPGRQNKSPIQADRAFLSPSHSQTRSSQYVTTHGQEQERPCLHLPYASVPTQSISLGVLSNLIQKTPSVSDKAILLQDAYPRGREI